MIEQIHHSGVDGGEGLLALIVRRSHEFPPGAVFITDSDEPMQVATMRWGDGHFVPAHMHMRHRREVLQTQEVLFVRRGEVLVRFYSSQGEFAREETIREGDVLVILYGAHSLKAVGIVELVECKSGPYRGRAKDKAELPGRGW